MRVAILNSNYTKISKNTKKGTEVFAYILIKNLLKSKRAKEFTFTAFTSGNSKIPMKSISFTPYDIMTSRIIESGYHMNFEHLHISQAFAMQKHFDLYHVNIGNGEMILPYAPFVKKPIILTLHGTFSEPQYVEFFSRAKKFPNIHNVSISNSQRLAVPNLNYIKTIYHGVDAKRTFLFDTRGGDRIVWAGRGVSEKGADVVLEVARKTGKSATLCIRTVSDGLEWLQKEVLSRVHQLKDKSTVTLEFDLTRDDLVKEYQSGKCFVFPIMWVEPFGLVIIESLACGTPVVAYARGSAPEIIVDGVTGYLVNPSDDEKYGDYIIKKTGVAGLCEAVERIYKMPAEQYLQMRHSCRKLVLEKFSVGRMIEEYIDLYEQLGNR